MLQYYVVTTGGAARAAGRGDARAPAGGGPSIVNARSGDAERPVTIGLASRSACASDDLAASGPAMGGLFSYFMGDPGPIPTVNPAEEERYTLPLGPVTDSSVPTFSAQSPATSSSRCPVSRVP